MKAVCPSVNLCIPIEGIFYPLLSRSFYFLNGIINYKEAKSGFFFSPHTFYPCLGSDLSHVMGGVNVM